MASRDFQKHYPGCEEFWNQHSADHESEDSIAARCLQTYGRQAIDSMAGRRGWATASWSQRAEILEAEKERSERAAY